MKRIFLSIYFLTLTCCLSLAQKNLQSGFIITNSFDTLHGFIDYRGDILNSRRCIFYKDLKSEPVNYSPGDIFAYRFASGRFYISKIVKTGSGENMVFLEYLVNGITNLYYMRNSSGDHYYIEKADEFYELSNSESVVTQNSNNYIKESNFYVGQLKLIYSDSQAILPSIDNIRFDRESMIRLSEDYHNLICHDRACIIYERKVKNMSLGIGPAISYRFARLEYAGILDPFKLSNVQTIYMGLETDMKFLSINEKLNLRIKGLFGKENCGGTYTDTVLSETHRNYIDYEKKKILTSMDVRYEFPRGKIRPAIAFGGEMSFIVNQETNLSEQTYTPGGDLIATSTNEHLIHFNPEGGFFAAAGFSVPVRKSSFQLEFYYGRFRGSYKYSESATSAGKSLWTTYKSRYTATGMAVSWIF